jgi:endogenous inhibitor of DNA gyrase (YacG/DUF329 family)|nr:DNA gyrase inhibitor YacG [Bradyrhizobium sp.]
MPARPPADAGAGKGPAGKAGTGTGKPCPICGKPAAEALRPFCSERCRDVDLNRWLSNSYAIPGAEDDDENAD